MTSIPGFGSHDCGDSRLSCVDCSGPVCPKCMIQCPVGNRCPRCAGRFTSHVLEVSPVVMIRTLAVAAAIGALFSLCGGGFSYGFYGWIITYVVGVFAGNIIHKAASFKLGPKIIATVTVGVIAGAVAVNLMLAPSATPMPDAEVREIREASINAGNRGNATATALAATTARKRWAEFEESFKAHRGSEFAVEAPFQDGSMTETMWVAVDEIKGDEISGRLANAPVKLHSMKSGDSVTVKRKDVQDWLYKDDKGYVGGFRVAMLRSQDEQADSYAAYKAMENAETMGLGNAVSFYIKLAIFIAGILTPIAGLLPPIRLPWLRW